MFYNAEVATESEAPAVAFHTEIEAAVKAFWAHVCDAGQHVLVRDGTHAAYFAASVPPCGLHPKQLAAHGCAVHGAIEGHVHGRATARPQAGEVIPCWGPRAREVTPYVPCTGACPAVVAVVRALQG